MYQSKGVRANIEFKCMCCGYVGKHTAKVADRGLCPTCYHEVARHRKGEVLMWHQCKACDIWYNRAIRYIVDGVRYYGVCSKECHDKHHTNIRHACGDRYRSAKRAVYHERINRTDVFKRDRYKCRSCGTKVSDKTAHLDHIMPISKGGPHTLCNLQTLCEPCNLSKSDKIPIGLTLSMFAYAPREGHIKDLERTHKECAVCNQELPIDAFRFKTTRRCYSSRCIDCDRLKSREAHARKKSNSPDYMKRTKERNDRWVEANREHRQAYMVRYKVMRNGKNTQTGMGVEGYEPKAVQTRAKAHVNRSVSPKNGLQQKMTL